MRFSSLRNIIDVGNSFIYKGNYCTVTKKSARHFSYDIQSSKIKGYMFYTFYITIPSYK
jgi:hypothetical protein